MSHHVRSWRILPLERNLRRRHVDQRRELEDVAVAVGHERGKGVVIERRPRYLLREGRRGRGEVVVAINQHAGRGSRDQPGQFPGGDVGEGKVDGATDMESGERRPAAAVEDHALRRGQGEECRFADPPLGPESVGLGDAVAEAGGVDERIGDRRRRPGTGVLRERAW